MGANQDKSTKSVQTTDTVSRRQLQHRGSADHRLSISRAGFTFNGISLIGEWEKAAASKCLINVYTDTIRLEISAVLKRGQLFVTLMALSGAQFSVILVKDFHFSMA